MLINLTDKNLGTLGRVFKGNITAASAHLGIPLIKNRRLTQSSFQTLYVHHTEKTALDRTDGTAILFCGFQPDKLQTFLLDKTVILNPGVYYYVLPLVGEAGLSVCAPAGTKSDRIPRQERLVSLLPSIEPTEIFTLLHHEKERGFSVSGEEHNFWELTYVERGELHNLVDGTDYLQHQGEIMLFLPNQFHRQYAAQDERVFYITVIFSMQFSDPDFFRGKIFKADHEMHTLFRQMLEERDGSRIYANDLILCQLKEIIIRLLRTGQMERIVKHASAESRPVLENGIILKTEAYVKKHLQERLTVSQIAASIPVSESYLSALFKRNTGESLNRYINHLKLSCAKDYIHTGRYTFTQIAQMLGYSNVHYFSQSFKRHVGMTPSEYANLLKGDTQA
ncbi:MAG: AraC family transcriptional regulator [Clostridia bacterium]|nr:AraC family transcriptional regulator [Clostridia bacterium]